MTDDHKSKNDNHSGSHSLEGGRRRSQSALSHITRIDSDDYLLQNDNDILNNVITEGKDLSNLHHEYDDNNNERYSISESIDSNGNVSIDSNISGSFSDNPKQYMPQSDNDKEDELHSDNETVDPTLSLKKQRTRLWSPKMKFERKKIFTQFIEINIIYALFCFIILVFCWGTVYNTSSHYNKIKILAVLQDDNVNEIMNSNELQSIEPVTNVFPELIDNVPGNWHVYNSSHFMNKYHLQTTEEINEKIINLIYDEHYWVGLNVKPNITYSILESLINENHTAFNATEHFQIIYESGRDPAHVITYMVPIVTEVQTLFNQYCIDTYLPSLVQNITENNISINWNNLATMINMKFETIDYRPFYDRILLVSSQIGDVFAILLSIFQFLIFGALHGQVAPLLRQRSRIYYRIAISMIIHFFSSLFWCTVSAMFQVDFTLKFGRGGFMIYWMSTWMYMWACGGINENVISILFSVYPQYLGFWILGFVLPNLTTAFFPMVLDNNFYRIGYIFPMRNIVDIHRVIFFGLSSSPQKLGRCYGILAAWIVLNSSLLPFYMKAAKKLTIWKAKRMQKQMERERIEKQSYK